MKTILFTVFLFSALFGSAQNIEKITDRSPIKVSGGLNYSSVFYNAQGIASRRDPFSWYLSGNLSLSVLGWSIPISYSYSNQHGTFAQPFNQYGATPYYKWVKLYLGFNSMTFSPYTLAGHTFLGGGAELTPGNWKVAVMYGRLNRAVQYDILNNNDNTMAYQRMGYGTKIGYEKNGTGITLTLFKAKDDLHSLTYIPENTQIVPQENTVVSLSGNTKIYKRISVGAEYALSGLTQNSFSESISSSDKTNYLPGIYKLKSSSQFYNAFKTSVGYTGNNYGVQINYERIDPDYKTLGAYYFNNDVKNITIAPSLNLMQGKLTVGINTGYQVNNLNRTKLNTTRRWVGAANIGFNPNEKWSFTLSYSNFNTFTKVRTQEDPFFKNNLDTLNFYQLSKDLNGSVNYTFGTDKVRHGLLLSCAYQVSGEKSGTANKSIPTFVYSGIAGYTLGWIPSKTTASLSFNYNKSELNSIGIATMNNIYWGPSLTVGKTFFNGLVRTSLGTTYNKTLNNNITGSSILNNRINLNYSPKLKNQKAGTLSFGISSSYLQRFKTAQQKTSIREFTTTINANYSF